MLKKTKKRMSAVKSLRTRKTKTIRTGCGASAESRTTTVS